MNEPHAIKLKKLFVKISGHFGAGNRWAGDPALRQSRCPHRAAIAYRYIKNRQKF